ncbi:unnamed protein product [Oncorhynchus mykiss]|uniref:Uncharacterized protein n=1 Tax=Oncorhynchus mykiss TaxID=8022 RepID=A0A060WR06_ONCMY|nr:unnamed protein product [Oncorhynchus mykiss]
MLSFRGGQMGCFTVCFSHNGRRPAAACADREAFNHSSDLSLTLTLLYCLLYLDRRANLLYFTSCYSCYSCDPKPN